MVRGHLGDSSIALPSGTNPRVGPLIASPVVNTVILASFAILFMIPLSIILGVLGAKYADRPLDHGISVVTLVFVVGSTLMLLLFDAFDPLPPVSLVPAGASPPLLLTDLAWTARLVWVGMHGVLRSDFIRSERLDGFPERRGDPEPGGSGRSLRRRP